MGPIGFILRGMASYYSNMEGRGYNRRPKQSSGRPRRRNNKTATNRFTEQSGAPAGGLSLGVTGRPAVGGATPPYAAPGANVARPPIPGAAPAMPMSGAVLGGVGLQPQTAPADPSSIEGMFEDQEAYWAQNGAGLSNMPRFPLRAGAGMRRGGPRFGYQPANAGQEPLQAVTPSPLNVGKPGYQSEADMVGAFRAEQATAGSGPYDSGAGRARFASSVYDRGPDLQQQVQQREDAMPGRMTPSGGMIVRLPNGRNLGVNSDVVKFATRGLSQNELLDPQALNDAVMHYVNDKSGMPGATEEQQSFRTAMRGGAFIGRNGNTGAGALRQQEQRFARQRSRAMTRNRRRFGATEAALTAGIGAPGSTEQGQGDGSTTGLAGAPQGRVNERQAELEKAMSDPVFDGFEVGGAELADYGDHFIENSDDWSGQDRQAFRAGLDAHAKRNPKGFGQDLKAILELDEINYSQQMFPFKFGGRQIEWMNHIRSLYGKPPIQVIEDSAPGGSVTGANGPVAIGF